MPTTPRLVFFGTPSFAVASLDKLCSSGYNVVAVVTAPDKPAGRGLKEKTSSVKEYALLHGIPVLQPVNLKEPEFLRHLASYRPDLQIVIAFRMLPKSVWELPPLGTFNLHASLLPQYRGAAPINRAIMNGERETGVTTFFINDAIDTGTILLSEKVGISENETAGELHDQLMVTGAGLVIRTVDRIVQGGTAPVKQETLIADPALLKSAPKIFMEDCRIDWNQEVQTIYNMVRGLSPSPGAFAEVVLPGKGTEKLKIFRSHPEPGQPGIFPGTFITDRKSSLKVVAQNGFLHLDELQLPGRKVMNSGDFLRGYGRFFPETPAI